MPLPQPKTFVALLILAGGLAWLSSWSTDRAIAWLNHNTVAARSSFASSNATSYTDAEFQFRHHLVDGENDNVNDYSDYDHSLSKRTKPVCPVGLPLGDINILVVTDIHGWIADQHERHEPQLDIDMGDVVSFYEQLQWPTGCPQHGDWFFLCNGDFMDGTGLSTVPPDHLVPLLEQVPFSAVNVGNHELYKNEVVDYMMNKGFINHWDGNYLASNVDYVWGQNSSIPFGSRYTFLKGAILDSTLLTFGFLYNFENNCNHTRVRRVEDTLREKWFLDVLTKSHYDGIIVMAHMDAVDPLVYKILDAIRAVVGPNMPVQFITGHTHRRHVEQLDLLATSMEAGRYMDTVGFVSFPLSSTVDYILDGPGDIHAKRQRASSLFQHRLLDANYKVLGTDVLGMPDEDFSTAAGSALSSNLKQTQERMGLLEVISVCAPQDYRLEKPMNDTDSLWRLYMQQVIPITFFPMLEATDAVPVFIHGTGALRYDLFSPRVVIDDIIAVTPFTNKIYQVGFSLSAEELLKVFDALHVDEVSPHWKNVGLPNFGVAGPRPTESDKQTTKLYDLYTVDFDVKQVYQEIEKAVPDTPRNPKPIYDAIDGNSDNPTQLATTKVWMDFVRNQWTCSGDDSYDDDFLSSEQSLPSLVATVAIAIVFVFVILLRRLRDRSEYKDKSDLTDTVSEISSLLGKDDEPATVGSLSEKNGHM